MIMISEKASISLLKVGFWIGALTDVLAIFPMVCPDVGLVLFGGQPSKLGVEYRFAMEIGVSLMAGWTILLLWGSMKPIKGRGVLVITLFPVVVGTVAATINGVTNYIIIQSGPGIRSRGVQRETKEGIRCFRKPSIFLVELIGIEPTTS
jgi:hypothetical protein